MANSAAARTLQAAGPDTEEFLDDVLRGLQARRKSLNPKYFYDENGSRLFERITRLPEYYITRTETRLMEQVAGDLGAACGDAKAVIEFGSGSGRRSDILLSALPEVLVYVPIDVSPELLDSTVRVVTAAHPHIRVCPLVADFTAEMSVPDSIPRQRLGYFPGSTIGNFSPADAIRFLVNARRLLGRHSSMLIGVDLTKSTYRLERAYNDSAGVTAAFNRNILVRINSELGGTFELDKFAHQAFFDAERSRIEMHLTSLEDQEVSIAGKESISFRAGETIHTENSYKYTAGQFRRLALQASWKTAAYWQDEEGLFSLHLLEHA